MWVINEPWVYNTPTVINERQHWLHNYYQPINGSCYQHYDYHVQEKCRLSLPGTQLRTPFEDPEQGSQNSHICKWNVLQKSSSACCQRQLYTEYREAQAWSHRDLGRILANLHIFIREKEDWKGWMTCPKFTVSLRHTHGENCCSVT